MIELKNNVLDYVNTPEYKFLLNKIIRGGTTDKAFFEGHEFNGDYRLQQKPCEFAAYLCWLYHKYSNYPIDYLELGSCAGGNLRHIAEILPKAIFNSCDNMSYPECQFQDFNFTMFKHRLNRFKGDSKSKEFINFLEFECFFDVAFIDGSHAFNDVINDYNNIKKYVDEYVVFHDTRIYMPESKIEASKAFEYLLENGFIKVHKHFENPNGKKLGITICEVLK